MSQVRIIPGSFSKDSLKRFALVLQQLLSFPPKQVVLCNTNSNINQTINSPLQLVETLQSDCCLLNLILKYLKGHMYQNEDGRLSAALLAVNIILKLKEDKVPLVVSQQVFTYLFELMEKFTEGLDLNMDIVGLNNIENIVRPIICSKILISIKELYHLKLLAAKSFSKILASGNQDFLNIMKEANSEIENSFVESGFLISLDKSFKDFDISSKLTHYKVLILDISLSYDTETLTENLEHVTLNIDSKSHLREDVFKEMEKFCKNLMPTVDLLFCQKVVHPMFQNLLQKNNVVVIDRIGLHNIQLFKRCNFRILSKITCIDNIKSYMETIDHIQFKEISERKYLFISSSKLSHIISVVLSAKSEDILERLDHCFQTALHALWTLSVKSNKVVFSNGCMETLLCSYLRSIESEEHLQVRLHCSHAQLLMCVSALAKSLLNVAGAFQSGSFCHHYIDNTYYHHWINPDASDRCCCGVVKITNNINLKYTSFQEFSFSFLSSRENIKIRKLKNDILKENIDIQSLSTYHSNLMITLDIITMVLRIGTVITES